MSSKVKVPFVNFGEQYRMHKKEYDEAIHRCLEQGKFILQEDLEEFEENLADFLGMKHAIGVGNGTDALTLALEAMQPVPRVMTATDYTFKATHEAIYFAGATVARADINPETRMPDGPVDIAVHIEGMVSHSKGAILEDAAQGIGAKGVGYTGTATYSFYPAKILGCFGDGGAVVTNSDEVARRVRLLRHHWQTDNREMYGYNSRLDNVQAAFLNVKLKYLPEILERREEIAEKYRALEGHVELPYYQEGRVWQDYVVRSPHVKQLVRHLKNHGIQTLGSGMTPPHKAMGSQENLPNSIALYETMFRLPCNETLTDEQIDYVIKTVQDYSTL